MLTLFAQYIRMTVIFTDFPDVNKKSFIDSHSFSISKVLKLLHWSESFDVPAGCMLWTKNSEETWRQI